MDLKELDARFTYHKPFGTQPERYIRIREQGKQLARMIEEYTPESREQSLAITAVEEAIMWANAAIARREVEIV